MSKHSPLGQDHNIVTALGLHQRSLRRCWKTSSNIGNNKSFVYDLNKERGIVRTRVAFVPRSAEIKPLFWRFVFRNSSSSPHTTRVGHRAGAGRTYVPLRASPRPVAVRGRRGRRGRRAPACCSFFTFPSPRGLPQWAGGRERERERERERVRETSCSAPFPSPPPPRRHLGSRHSTSTCLSLFHSRDLGEGGHVGWVAGVGVGGWGLGVGGWGWVKDGGWVAMGGLVSVWVRCGRCGVGAGWDLRTLGGVVGKQGDD